MKRKLFVIVLLTLLSGILLISCEKEPGAGGNSTIYGKVFVKDYNSSFTVLQEEYYGPNIWVYIIYGDDRDYGDRIRTNYDGTYEFKYLRTGTYHIYAYSKDSTLQTAAPVAVRKDVDISKNKETIEVPDLIIFN
jgi:hypothetical protein